MMFTETAIPGAFIIEPERIEDHRGFFARTWCEREMSAHGITTRVAQSSISFNKRQGTLRGLHYQVSPHEEAKLVRCTMGAIHDVIVDLRRHSPAFKSHLAVTLSSENHKMLYVPEGCAHGFQTLEDDTEVFYQISKLYAPDHGRGVRWDDPAFAIPWPPAERIILERDRNYPDFSV
jgi:dTDP-4-dehydrorhamnose 3,5-epimerase